MAFTIDDLRSVLREGAGDDGGLTEDQLDTAFSDIGFESLQLLEVTVLVRQRFGVDLDDSVLTGVDTPRELIALVNKGLATAASR
ncbi:acyl carrier protein [Lentzea sp. NBRC 102530]|uniref:acyl carrier protein n=1 Tax=Lentzea sp. NBRC 102530 TaxID=3032201 RepID=UPI0024A48805|nr:acyl carrier protein [Lentzea sp. NBRC 102530]GLY46856.1 actinorhodin polyketide synthase acyl carrier protein [Lentzea sp. NBRC 102530]